MRPKARTTSKTRRKTAQAYGLHDVIVWRSSRHWKVISFFNRWVRFVPSVRLNSAAERPGSSIPLSCIFPPVAFTMSSQLEYQECYRRLAHTSVINAIVLSHDGRRLVTGSDDSTVLVWSTQSGSAFCRIKTHSPVLSLALMGGSTEFILGCANGRLASVDLSEVLYSSLPFPLYINVSSAM